MWKENQLKNQKCKSENKKQPGDRVALIGVGIGLLIAAVCGCPIYRFLGICCPCCGVTRAWICLFRGDVSSAFRYHGLFPLLPLLAVLYIWHGKIPHKWEPTANAVVIIGSVAVAAYGVLRWCGFVAMP